MQSFSNSHGVDMSVKKEFIEAKARVLTTRWDPARQEEHIRNVARYVISEAMKRNFLQQHGTRVSLYTKCWDETREWCQDHCQSMWELSRDSTLSDPTTLRVQVGVEEENNEPIDPEVYWINGMISQYRQDIVEESSQLRPIHYAWFEDPHEAMMFKLIWGGK